MSDPWESLPDVPAATSWEDLPDVAPQAPLSTSVADVVPGFTAEDVSAQVVADEKAAKSARRRLAFEEARKVSEDDSVAMFAIAGGLNLPVKEVRKSLPELRRTAELVGWDDEKWAAENPQLDRMLQRSPQAGQLVIRNVEIGPIVKALHDAGDWFKDAVTSLNEALPVPAETLAEQKRQMTGPDFAPITLEGLDAANTPLTPEQITQRDAARVERDAPKPQVRRDDVIARIAREKTGLGFVNMFLWQKAIEAKKGMDLQRKNVRLMFAANGFGGDETELRAEIHDMKLDIIPRDLGGESGLLRDLSEGIQGVVSSADVGADVLKATGAAGAGAFVLGGGAALAITKNPAEALAVGIGAARAVGGAVVGPASFLSATELETGSSWDSLSNEVTERGEKLTPAEAMGGAILEGLGKGILETISFGQQTKVLKQVIPGNIRARLIGDPTFRALAAQVTREYGKSIAVEGGTEWSQDGIEQVDALLQKTLHDGAAQSGPWYDATRGAQALQGGVFGAALAGTGTSILSLAATKTADAKSQVADRQVGPLLQLAEQPAVRAAPAEFAQLVAETTGENGKAVTSLHVDAAAVVRFFQDKGQDGEQANATVAELLGPEAPAALLEAAATGGKLEVPMEKVLSTWGASDIGKALADDTSTDATGPTPRQRKEQAAEIEAETARIVEAETKKLDEAQLLADRTQALEQQLVESGISKDKAKATAAMVRVFQEVQASDFGKAVSEVVPETPISVAKGDETASQTERVAQLPSDELASRAETADATTRAAELFTDPVSGLRTRRAWDESPHEGQVAVITSPDIKAINDAEQGGHDTANELLRLIGGVVGGIDPEAARSGTNFLIHAKSREALRTALAAIKAALPEGLTVEGATGTNLDEAFKKLDTSTEAKRAKGTLPARGQSAFKVEGLTPETFAAGKAAKPNLSPALLARAEATKGEAFRKEAYQDKDIPGVLSKTGFDALPEKAYASAFDLRGLKKINEAIGKQTGDRLLRVFGEAALKAGGGKVAFAHLSGDEYAAKHDNRAELEAFEERLLGELRKVGVDATLNGEEIIIRAGFRSGIGEKTYGAADRVLNAAKRKEAAQGNDVLGGGRLPGAEPRSRVEGAVDSGGRQAGLAREEVTRLNQDQTESAAFKAWFGKSKVVDSKGKPLVVFHGTKQDFDAFDPKKIGSNFSADARGFFFTSSAKMASEYASGDTVGLKGDMPGANVIPAFVSLQRPLVVDDTFLRAEGINPIGIDEDVVTFWDNFQNFILEKVDETKADGVILVDNTYRPDGEPTRMVVAFKPTQIKSAIGNRGTFSKTNPSILRQDSGDAPKGYTELPAGRALQATVRVFLNKSADVSTAIHEVGHAFLEHLFDLSERADAPQRTKDTAAAALEAFGVESRKEVTREHHEQFARAFEAYAFEGKAPSSALKKVFAKFTRWLVQVYRTLASIPGTELSAELRPVFDALLATQDQLDAARRAEGPKLAAKDLGVTEQERQQQLEEEADDYTEGSQKAQLAAVKDALRLREKWWKDGLKKLEANFADEYEALPARRAQVLLMEDEMVLDRKLVEDVIGQAKFPGLRTAATGGVRPSVVAELAGYASPRAMLAELAGLRSKESWVKAQSEAAMRQLHPGILDDLTRFKRELSDGLRSATEKRLLREWKELPREALKRAAVELASRRRVDQLKPNRALAQQRQAAQAKARAAAKGDIKAASEAARTELLNHFLFHELRKAEVEMEKTADLAKSLGKASAREKLGKASPVYRDAADFIRAELGFGESTGLDVSTLQAAVAQMNGDAVLIGDPEWLEPVKAAIAVEGGFQKLTVTQGRAVSDALKNLKAAAHQRSTVLADGKRIDREQAVAELLAEADANKKPAPAVGSRAVADIIRRVGGAFSAPLLKIETMVGWLGGNLTGKDERQSAWHRYVYRVLEGARQRESDLNKVIGKPVLDALEAMPSAMKRSMGDGWDGASFFPQHGLPGSRQKLAAPTRRHELLAMALNAGNESNLERLLGGRSITMQQLTAALNGLTKEEIAWVNTVHEAFEASWPEIQAMEERLTGIRPEGVKKQALPLANGTIKGGYFPALYDSRISGVGPMQDEASIAAMFGPAFGRPGTAHGHTKSRVQGFVGPIDLNLNAIPIHLAQHIHDLAFREPVISVASLVLDKKIQDALFASLGPERAKQFKPWVADSARVQGLEGAETAGHFLNALSKLRGNVSVAALGYSLPNAIEDFSGIPAALADRELKPGAWAKGLAAFYGSPMKAWADISTKSAHMRSTDETRTRDLTHQIKNLTLDGPAPWRAAKRLHAFVQRHAFVFQETSFRLTAGPLWLARHGQELAAGGSERSAVEAADALTRRLFPAHGAVNQPGISRNKYLAPFVQFYSFFSSVVNKNLDEWQRLLEAPGGEAKIRAAVRATAYVTTLGLLGGVMRGRGPKDDEEPEEWALWAMLSFMLAQVPFGGDVNQVLEATGKGKPVTARPGLVGSGVMAFAEGLKALDSEREPGERALSTLKAAGPLVGIPSSATSRTGRYVAGAVSGEEGTSPADVVSGGIFGPTREGDSDLLRDFWAWLNE